MAGGPFDGRLVTVTRRPTGLLIIEKGVKAAYAPSADPAVFVPWGAQ